MKIILGAGGKTQENWISTEQGQLDVMCRSDFEKVLNGEAKFECMLAEHVFEHLELKDIPTALKNCFDFLSLNGRLRIAVPDGFHPDPEYIDYVKPNGTGAGADTHQILFNYLMLRRLMREVGFDVELLEWWDEDNKFNARLWNEIDGCVERSLANDPRNTDGKPHYTSLIVDGIKREDPENPSLKKAFNFLEKHDINKVSPFNKKKTTVLYELAKSAPEGGSIVELGSYHGNGTAALWYGAQDGNKNPVIAVDAYTEMRGWANEPYTEKDMDIWLDNMMEEEISAALFQGDVKKMSWSWEIPISLLVHDLGTKNRMPDDVMDWERYVIVGGVIALRDIDDYSMGTERAIFNLTQTGRWGNRRNWEAFITSVERIR